MPLLLAMMLVAGCADHAEATPLDRARAATVLLADEEGTSTGTLVRFRGEVLVLTAAHVVDDNGAVSVWDRDRGDLMGIAKPLVQAHDIALMRYEGDVGVDPLPLRWAPLPSVGDELTYTAHPQAIERATFSARVVDDDDGSGQVRVEGFAWPGASGAAAVDRRGRVVGVVSSILVGGSHLLEDLVSIEPMARLERGDVREAIGEDGR